MRSIFWASALGRPRSGDRVAIVAMARRPKVCGLPDTQLLRVDDENSNLGR
jgi:hypothetical protein